MGSPMAAMALIALGALSVAFADTTAGATVGDSGTFKAAPSLNASDSSFRVCGAYCGPGWCNNEWLEEENCDDSAPVESHADTGPSCADLCCKAHDKCCGHGDRKVCNDDIVACLNNCDDLSVTCTRDDIPVPAGTIKEAMKIVEGWCCGAPC